MWGKQMNATNTMVYQYTGNKTWDRQNTQYCVSDKIKKNEMGGACSAFGGSERHVQDFGEETWGNETAGETQTYMGG